MKAFVRRLTQNVAFKPAKDEVGVEQSPGRPLESSNQDEQDVVSESDNENSNDYNGSSVTDKDGDDDDSDDDEDDSDDDEDDSDDDDDDDDDSGESGTTDTDSPSKKDEEISFCEYEQIKEYASEENRRVHIWRIVVIGSILVAGAVMSALTYVLLYNEIQNDYNDDFSLLTNGIEDAFTHQLRNIFTANNALAEFVTLNSMNNQQTFPHVSVPGFEVQSHAARISSGIEWFKYAPIAFNFREWITFANATKGWLDDSKLIYDQLNPGSNRSADPPRTYLPPVVYRFDENGFRVPWFGDETNATPFCPRLYTSPPPYQGDGIVQNEDLYTKELYKAVSSGATESKDVAISEFRNMSDIALDSSELNENMSPLSITAKAVYPNLGGPSTDTVGYIFSLISWEKHILRSVQSRMNETVVVLRNSCAQAWTFQRSQNGSSSVNEGDIYSTTSVRKGKTIDFLDNYANSSYPQMATGNCKMSLDVYPSAEFTANYDSNSPLIFTSIIATMFLLMAAIFFVYDSFVKDRNDKVITAAARSNAIVSSLFPSNVRDRLLAEKGAEEEKNKNGKIDAHRSTLKGFLAGETEQDTEMQDGDVYKSKPIADLFPDTTVMFGDIVGFTAWSSVREPSQVFTLLETIYHTFDEVARKRRVFKVETVGDCYVAVCGLPDPNRDHAVNMCRFAKDCMYKMFSLVKKLEVVLGPDTADLSMRMGLHSGPVTAGVLRGERSRFQLFGDTMNTAARMESNGKKSRIHLSQETADLLIAAGKSMWVTARDDKIIAKGKGELQTYWLELTDKAETGSAASGDGNAENRNIDDSEHVSAAIAEKTGIDPGKTERLIDWNVEVLLRLLKQVVARRQHQGRKTVGLAGTEDLMLKPARGQTVLDEVKEIITLPQFDSSSLNIERDCDYIEMNPKIADQLHDYVWNIASMYRNNPFHNFEHASHVTMSVVKLLSRIVAPSENDRAGVGEDASSLHDHTYGITSDPLTQFSCVLSALIHDLDHPGVPNAQLVKENSQIASVYKNKSVAEQNSVDIAWHLLMDERYDDLRCTIYTDEIEMKRFRQLVVNSVMATDIVDKELKNLRNARWEKAFSDVKHDEDIQDTINRKATIVIEHLIQASDVAHTMQHWHIYRKWNERFFLECYKAYKDGRAEADPSTNWYSGEIGFFDFYIIPLCKKLKNCGVFGVSSDEYLNYAVKNRQEWEHKGQDVVAEMIENVKSIWP